MRGSWQHTKMVYSVDEAADLLSISRAQIYRLIDLKELETIKIGRSRRITYAQLEAFIQRIEQATRTRGSFSA